MNHGGSLQAVDIIADYCDNICIKSYQKIKCYCHRFNLFSYIWRTRITRNSLHWSVFFVWYVVSNDREW
jgi:hypothetical protein